ncbi:DUF397 domain-containing protein [Streptomyces sp. NPDC029004]|uniref:DUF397 domain-containing protein n=1 Tax=Streptomyces sp. NPDC029004 TaxID=3154490 RepID=UPI00340ED494
MWSVPQSAARAVEIAAAPGTVHVRDSKDKAGAQLVFTDGSWAAFVPFAASR